MLVLGDVASAHLYIHDSCMLMNGIFHLSWRYVFATPDDQVLQATNNSAVAISVQHSQIACVHPSCLVNDLHLRYDPLSRPPSTEAAGHAPLPES